MTGIVQTIRIANGLLDFNDFFRSTQSDPSSPFFAKSRSESEMSEPLMCDYFDAQRLRWATTVLSLLDPSTALF
jgi:hypothetical protein